MIRIHNTIASQPIAALIPYARNARTHSPEQVDQIASSIREFGFTNPILVDETGNIIAGHGRVMAAQQPAWFLSSHIPADRIRRVSEWMERQMSL